MFVRISTAVASVLWLMVPTASAETCGRPRLDALEKIVAGDPESLSVAADYRQLAIACGAFDRSIDLFEKLAKRSGSGPDVQISLALAYVDKVPVSGNIRKLYLGRDALRALTRAIDQQPSVLAYGVRGVINLFYQNAIFHRAHLGVEDLQKALSLVNDDTPPALVHRVWVALGDGYWRDEKPAKSREIWATGAAKFPDSPELKARLSGDDRQVARIIRRAYNDDYRLDTSLRGLLARP